MKIVLRVPHYSDMVFESYEDLNLIWKVIEDYNDCQLIIVDDENEEEFDKQQEIKENIETVADDDDYAVLSFLVPKSVTFTQRFQDRVKKEIIEILDSVYPNSFNIKDITYNDIDDDLDNMKMIIRIKAVSDSGAENLKYLDKNVEFIMNDLINYYL